MKNFQSFSMDTTTWNATIGAGTLLEDVTKKLSDAGGRAIAHGVCPQVGTGSHLTIGGFGPLSRMWGTALDHVLSVQVVLADSRIVRASATENPDVSSPSKVPPLDLESSPSSQFSLTRRRRLPSDTRTLLSLGPSSLWPTLSRTGRLLFPIHSSHGSFMLR